MSIRIMSAVWETSLQTGGNLLLLLALADFANDAGECWPAVSTLARKARMTDRHVHRVLRQLEEAKEIARVDLAGQNGTIRYRVLPTPDKMSERPAGPAPLTSETPTPDAGVTQSVMNHQEPSGAKKSTEDEVTLESIAFVEAFLKLLSDTGAKITPPTTAARVKWADTYEKLVRIDGKTKGDIWRVCVWARNDNFWKGNFFSPVKLRLSGDDGIRYYDKFSAKMASSNGNSPNGKHHSRGFSGGNVSAYAELDLKLAAQP